MLIREITFENNDWKIPGCFIFQILRDNHEINYKHPLGRMLIGMALGQEG